MLEAESEDQQRLKQDKEGWIKMERVHRLIIARMAMVTYRTEPTVDENMVAWS